MKYEWRPTVYVTLSVILFGIGGCSSNSITDSKGNTSGVTDSWRDQRMAAKPETQKILDELTRRENGDRWNGPYRSSELRALLPVAFGHFEFPRWVEGFYGSRDMEFFVLTKGVGHSSRDLTGSSTILDRVPVCVISLNPDGERYVRFVFNAPHTCTLLIK